MYIYICIRIITSFSFQLCVGSCNGVELSVFSGNFAVMCFFQDLFGEFVGLRLRLDLLRNNSELSSKISLMFSFSAS